LPTIEELAARPERAAALTRDEVQRLLVRHAAAGAVLFARLLACGDDAPTRASAGPNLNADEAASYLRIRRSTLDTQRRRGHLPATKLGKAYTYRREDLDRLRDKLTVSAHTNGDNAQ
jgi:excisionase family DNA binding protein